METREVVQKGNILEVEVTVHNQNTYFHSSVSPEFVISGAAVFMLKATTIANGSSQSCYNYHFNYNYCQIMVFVRFTKRRADDHITYSIKFNSLKLNVTDKCLTSDDGTLHLIYEKNNSELPFTFDVAVHMEQMRRASPFASLHDDTELTDFELRGEDGSVHVHRAVLAAASPVLRRMLSGEWRETAEGRVNVTGTSKATLQHLKNYLYLHTLPESGLEQLLVLSTYYMMPELEQQCVDKLVSNVSAENACDMIEFAVKHKAMRLLLAILDCVQCGAVNVTKMHDQLALCDQVDSQRLSID